MAFPHKKGSYLDWLQSGVDDYSVYLNQLNQGYMNVPEEAALLNVIHETHIANDSIINQGHKIVAEGYHNHASYVKEWCKSVRQVDGPVSTDAVMHSNVQQPDSSACSSKVAEGNSKTHSDSQDGWFDEEEDDNEPYMWEGDHDGKSFSSWLLYGSDDDMEIFKNVLNKDTTGGKEQLAAEAYNMNSLIAKATAQPKGSSSSKRP